MRIQKLIFAVMAVGLLSANAALADTVKEDCDCIMPPGLDRLGFYEVIEKSYYVERFRGLPAVVRVLRARSSSATTGSAMEKIIIYQLVFSSEASTVGTPGPIIRIVNDPDDYTGLLDPEEKPLFSLPLEDTLKAIRQAMSP